MYRNSFLASDYQGTMNLTFFQKMKNTNPFMGAKLKSKTHLQNTILDFEPFFVCLASKLSNSATMTQKKFYFKKSKKISKNAEFHAEKCTQKSYKQNKFDEHE